MKNVDTIHEVLKPIYGESGFIYDLAKNIHQKLTNPDVSDREFSDPERMVMETCWNWMTGGTTAEYAAKRVMEAWNA